MDNSPSTLTRATPARRSRRKRPALCLVRSRDVPDAPAEASDRAPKRYVGMLVLQSIAWPCPAQIGELVALYPQSGHVRVVREPEAGEWPEVWPEVWSGTVAIAWDRIAAMRESLQPLTQDDGKAVRHLAAVAHLLMPLALVAPVATGPRAS